MLRIMYYALKQTLGRKQEIFWILVFPILLGTMFKFAFSGISESEAFLSIPVAVVSDNQEALTQFKLVADSAKSGDSKLLIPTYCDDESALTLLKDGEVTGIITVDYKISLTVSSSSSEASTEQSILNCFVSQYNVSSRIMQNTLENHPENFESVVDSLSRNITYNESVSLAARKTDTFDQYFYNLIAMACLFTSMIGLNIAIDNQANLSTLGARKNVAPMHKLKLVVGELTTAIIFNYLLTLIAYAYIVLALGIDLTTNLPYSLFAVLVACMTGITFGFFIGSIPTSNRTIKEAMLLIVTLGGGFMSGLMVGNMRIVIETYCPIINKINPSALISDSFYSLANYDSMGRYYTDIATLIILVVIFTLGGFVFTRRKKYASI